MTRRQLLISDRDHRQLTELLDVTRRNRFEDPIHVERLQRELDNATIVAAGDMPGEVVRLHSRVKLEFPYSRQTTTVQIMPPLRWDLIAGRISILSPLGTALIGRRAGDEVQYTVRNAPIRAKILSVQQPRGSGKRRAAQLAQNN